MLAHVTFEVWSGAVVDLRKRALSAACGGALKNFHFDTSQKIFSVVSKSGGKSFKKGGERFQKVKKHKSAPPPVAPLERDL